VPTVRRDRRTHTENLLIIELSNAVETRYVTTRTRVRKRQLRGHELGRRSGGRSRPQI